MEDESQKMVALKKAYADIILNTAKEAAARVMASERKGLRFQHDLNCTKDEAVRVLVHLKQMLDSKTSEAEITSLNQQRKIEELEAQLQEAEDIITDLRAELRQVWSQLERVHYSQVKPLDEQITREDPLFSESPAPELVLSSPTGSGPETVPTSVLNNIPLNSGIDCKCCDAEKQTEQLSVSDLDKFYAPDPDLASIIMITKEPELLRNGCTQRIRAFERNLIDQNLLPSGYNNLNSQGKNELAIKASDKEEANCSFPSFRDNSMEVVNNPSVGETRTPANSRLLRRRKTQLGKARTSRQCHSSELMSSRQATSLPSECIIPSVKTDHAKMTRTSSHLKYMGEVKTIPKGKRTKRMKCKDGISTSCTGQPTSILSRCMTLSFLGNAGVKSCEDPRNTTESEVQVKPLPCLDPGLMLTRSDVDSISGSTVVTGAAQNAADKDMELIDVPVLLMEESDVVENSESPSPFFPCTAEELPMDSELKDVKVSVIRDVKVSLMNSELEDVKASWLNSELKYGTVFLSNSGITDANVSLVNTELKDVTASSEQSNGSPCAVANSRLIKYTFQRKRKNSCRNPGQIASVEENTAKRRIEEKECPEKQPKMTNESTRESRRLAQVARQLISLSGKR